MRLRREGKNSPRSRPPNQSTSKDSCDTIHLWAFSLLLQTTNYTNHFSLQASDYVRWDANRKSKNLDTSSPLEDLLGLLLWFPTSSMIIQGYQGVWFGSPLKDKAIWRGWKYEGYHSFCSNGVNSFLTLLFRICV